MQYLERFVAASTATPAGGQVWEWNSSSPTAAQTISAITGCVATGSFSLAGGYACTASGDYSLALGFSCNATGSNAIALGDSAQASGNNAIALNSIASGIFAFAAGTQAIASGDNSVAIGFYVTASRQYATALGYETVAAAERSTAIGDSSQAEYWSQLSHASGKFTNKGDAQTIYLNWFGTTSDSNFASIYLDGLSRKMSIGHGYSLFFDITVQGRWISGTNGNVANFAIKKALAFITWDIGAAGTTLTVVDIYAASDVGADIKITTDGTNFDIQVTQGDNDQVWKWHATAYASMLKL